jgi:hypothetical protein
MDLVGFVTVYTILSKGDFGFTGVADPNIFLIAELSFFLTLPAQSSYNELCLNHSPNFFNAVARWDKDSFLPLISNIP